MYLEVSQDVFFGAGLPVGLPVRLGAEAWSGRGNWSKPYSMYGVKQTVFYVRSEFIIINYPIW